MSTYFHCAQALKSVTFWVDMKKKIGHFRIPKHIPLDIEEGDGSVFGQPRWHVCALSQEEFPPRPCDVRQ